MRLENILLILDFQFLVEMHLENSLLILHCSYDKAVNT